MPDAVICKALRKSFGTGGTEIEVLCGLDLRIPLGELTMLVGPSGCGKTTLISTIAGLLAPSGGTLRVLGHDLAELSPAELIAFRQANIGFVFQQFNLLPAITAEENAAVPLFVAGWKRRHAIERARELLVELGLEQRISALPANLSGGEQQRVAFARAMIHDPALIVCDEPTSALDATTGHRVMELLGQTAVRPGRALIVVTHDSRIFDFADGIARMEDGRITGFERRLIARSFVSPQVIATTEMSNGELT